MNDVSGAGMEFRLCRFGLENCLRCLWQSRNASIERQRICTNVKLRSERVKYLNSVHFAEV